MSNCMNCGKDVISKGTKPAKYCSDKCRKAYGRKQPDITTNGQVQQTDKPVRGQGIANYGQEDCACQHCKGVSLNRLSITLNHGQYRPASHLANEHNRCTLPGDVDYNGVCN